MITRQPQPGERIEYSTTGENWQYAGTVVKCEDNICHLYNETLPAPASQIAHQGEHLPHGPLVNNCLIYQFHDGTFNRFHRTAP